MAEGGVDPGNVREKVERQPLPDLFVELVDDGRDWLNAEIAVYRAEARRRLIIAGIGLGLMTLAAALVAGTVVALLVGVVFALAPVIGAGGAAPASEAYTRREVR